MARASIVGTGFSDPGITTVVADSRVSGLLRVPKQFRVPKQLKTRRSHFLGRMGTGAGGGKFQRKVASAHPRQRTGQRTWRCWLRTRGKIPFRCVCFLNGFRKLIEAEKGATHDFNVGLSNFSGKNQHFSSSTHWCTFFDIGVLKTI